MIRSLALLIAIAPALLAQAKTPPSMDEIAIVSHGARLNALAYHPAGPGTHPVVVFLHGFPGNERNLDLAQSVRRAGYEALYVDYRGNWGSGGTFSFAHGLEDVSAILAWVRNPANAAKYHFDTSRIAIVGHSFGGWLMLMSARREPPTTCMAAMAAWNIGWDGARLATHADERRDALDYFRSVTDSTGGPIRTSAAALIKEMSDSAASYNYLSQAAALASQPLLLVAASHDTPNEDPAMHAQLAAAIRKVGGKRVEVVNYEDDHPFSAHRSELSDTLVHWLRTTCFPPGR